METLSRCVWRCFRFPLGFREAGEPMLERGVLVSDETIRRWCLKSGQSCAHALRRRPPRPGDPWHLGEVFITVTVEQKHLGRAAGRAGTVLDILVQHRRTKAAARRFFRRLLNGIGAVPRVIVTDRGLQPARSTGSRVVSTNAHGHGDRFLADRLSGSPRPA
ncbi:DDE-type integrase/transposase/recombinase [Streptomyces chlorus]|uniref:DDE-type integrase/transposase/recombinase n=1 Tax=Streptomyces chlorus TaxID=887452 RepID=A0ABW1E8W6_9ACTN